MPGKFADVGEVALDFQRSASGKTFLLRVDDKKHRFLGQINKQQLIELLNNQRLNVVVQKYVQIAGEADQHANR